MTRQVIPYLNGPAIPSLEMWKLLSRTRICNADSHVVYVMYNAPILRITIETPGKYLVALSIHSLHVAFLTQTHSSALVREDPYLAMAWADGGGEVLALATDKYVVIRTGLWLT